MLPKRGCDVSTCEITRFYRLNNNGFCQVIPFVVPRKSELFQEDLYPDTLSDVPAITADEWWCGSNADPVMVPMNERGVQVKKVYSRDLNTGHWKGKRVSLWGKFFKGGGDP